MLISQKCVYNVIVIAFGLHICYSNYFQEHKKADFTQNPLMYCCRIVNVMFNEIFISIKGHKNQNDPTWSAS